MYDSANRLISAGGHTYTYNAEMVVNMKNEFFEYVCPAKRITKIQAQKEYYKDYDKRISCKVLGKKVKKKINSFLLNFNIPCHYHRSHTVIFCQ